MFRQLNIAMRCFRDTGALRISPPFDRLTLIPLGIQWFHVLPEKAARFVFRGWLPMRSRQARIAAGS
jgi:hypothetical protein